MENSSVKYKIEKSNFVNLLDKVDQLKNDQNRTEPHQAVRLTAHPLERLCNEENLNKVIITLYPENEGYSLSLKIKNSLDYETPRISYEEDELLKCLDNQQLAPALVELLEEVGAEIFYNGCVLVEVRDQRSSKSSPSRHVLLRPTTQSIIADAQRISDEQGWGVDERFYLESLLCMATSEPLCLDPNPQVGQWACAKDSTSKASSSKSIQKCIRKFCKPHKRKRDDEVVPREFRLLDFLEKKGKTLCAVPTIPRVLPVESPSVDSVVDTSDVERLAKRMEWPRETSDCSLVTLEEYLLETDRTNGKMSLVRLSVLHRPATDEFSGQLYVDCVYKDGKNSKGASCAFPLGSRSNVNRYIQQFMEIFTEEGRKSVKITHQVPGQPARVMLTQGMKEKEKEKLRDRQESAGSNQSQSTDNSEETSDTNATAQPEANNSALTKAALLESLKSGQVTPAIATLVSSLLTSSQQHQLQTRPSVSAILSNGQAAPQQSLLKPAIARPQMAASVQQVQLVTQPANLQQQQQQPEARPTTLATLLAGRNVVSGTVVNQAPAKAVLTNAKTPTAILPQGDPAAAVQNAAAATGAKVSAAALVAKAIRPSTSTIIACTTLESTAPVLPTYSQATGVSSASHTTAVRQVRPALITNGVAAAGTAAPVRLVTDAAAPRASLKVPALRALLAGTPSADSPGVSSSSAAGAPSSSLLERLQQASPSKSQVQPGSAATHVVVGNQVKAAAVRPSNNTVNVQSINLTGIQGAIAAIPTVQSIQMSALNVGGTVRPAAVPTSGQPISIPLSVLQIQNNGGAVQLVSAVQKTANGPTQVIVTNNTSGVQNPTNSNSGSLVTQQQLQLALQRQVQLQLQQKMAAKQKNPPK